MKVLYYKNLKPYGSWLCSSVGEHGLSGTDNKIICGDTLHKSWLITVVVNTLVVKKPYFMQTLRLTL